MNEMVAAVAARRPRTLVPLLTGIFIIVWILLSLLVVMQDRMIDAQAELIHTFYKQSLPQTRSHVAGKAAVKQSEKHARTKLHGRDLQVAPAPENSPSSVSQIPLSERASAQSPSSQVKPKGNDKSGRSMRKGRSPFSPPPSEITDPSDQRRVLNSI